jgi:hypothetical protein
MTTYPVRLRSLAHAFALFVCIAAVASSAHAQGGCLNGGSGGCSVPEINPGTLTQALTLLAGTGLWLRSRRRP